MVRRPARILSTIATEQASRVTAVSSLGSLPGRMAGRLDRLSDRQFAFIAFLPGGLLVGLVLLPPIPRSSSRSRARSCSPWARRC